VKAVKKLMMMTGMMAASSFAFSMPLAAQCVTVDPVIVPALRVDPLDTTGAAQIMQPVTITFRRVGAGNGPLRVTYQIVDEDSTGAQRVGVTSGPQLEWRAGDSGRNIGASRNEAYALLRSGIVALGENGTSGQSALRLFLPNLREDFPAGVYREQFTVRYWCEDEDVTRPYEARGIVTVAVQVPNVLSANVAGASTRGEIDFLDFATLSRALAVSVRSTGPFAVTAESLNGSVMLREGARGSDSADRIPYVVTFGGRPLTLGAASSFTSPRTGLAGQQIPLNVTVGDVSTKRAGRYSDTLVLTLAPVS
jgi:hypothetical protein